MPHLKIGELAKRTGLTVRTLHHYDEIGLLAPERRSDSGYRLYGEADVARLQQIRSLRQMGWSLTEIRKMLERRDVSVLEVVDQHLGRLEEQLALQRTLRDRLQEVARKLRATGDASVDDFLRTIEVMTMYENYYTPEQRDLMKQRAQEVGEDRIRQVEAEWHTVFDGFRAEMEKGADPTGEASQALARKARGLIEEFTGGNAGIEQSLGNLYREEGGMPDVLGRHGYDLAPGVAEYMGKAMAALASS